MLGRMNVVIVGGGEIGSQIAEALQHSHNITIVDTDPDRAAAFEAMDVRFVHGNGADPEDLRTAQAGRADAFIACTINDDVNVLACLAAKGLGAKETMAFVTRKRYVEAFAETGSMKTVGLVIDRLLWPQRTLAKQMVDIVRVPRAVISTAFADGRVRLLEYKLEPGDPFLHQPLAEVRLPANVLVAGAIQGDAFVIPSGRTVLAPGDKAIFMGTANSMRAFEARFARRKRHPNVVIIGGGNVGFMVAEELQGDGAHLTVIEQDEARCERLAKWLPGVLVLRGDGTDLELLESERIEDADALLALTDDDAKNLLVSLLGKQLGIPKVITRVGRSRNRRLFERVGIDIPLTPRTAAVQEVLNWLHLDNVEHLASIEDRAEVMDVVYPPSCKVGRIRDLGAPPRSLIGAVLRGDEVIIPTGETTLRHGDHLYIVTTPDNVGAVQRWLGQLQSVY
ncbi:TrkA-N domain protein [Truepera radiovictrix DSM 17093]|uniref:Trk system potassium uptake protein TrkA n=2 Tax=Truepera TaxID=332248 RepID=D7CY24_TRURR|nr:TrkA-N domain protein [Truepera radiovictrix DSM 17093]